MAMPTIEELVDQCARVRGEPQIPFRESQGRSKSELLEVMTTVRSMIIDSVQHAPEAAFESQSEDPNGNEVWSIGEIIGHCNAAVVDIGGRALDAAGVEVDIQVDDDPDFSAIRVRSQDEALAAARAADYRRFYDALPDDDELDRTHDVGFFGTMSARSWLYFMTMHEAEHIAQIQDLSSRVKF